jgi:hypothetical protein
LEHSSWLTARFFTFLIVSSDIASHLAVEIVRVKKGNFSRKQTRRQSEKQTKGRMESLTIQQELKTFEKEKKTSES